MYYDILFGNSDKISKNVFFYFKNYLCKYFIIYKIVRKKCFLKKFIFSVWLVEDCKMFFDNFVVNCMKILFLLDWLNFSFVNFDCKFEIFRLEFIWYLISCRYCSLIIFESDIDV